MRSIWILEADSVTARWTTFRVRPFFGGALQRADIGTIMAIGNAIGIPGTTLSPCTIMENVLIVDGGGLERNKEEVESA